MLFVNLSISDTLAMTFQSLPVAFMPFYGRFWPWSAFICKLYGCVGAIFGKISNVSKYALKIISMNLSSASGSICSLIAIGYDRYNIICTGLNANAMTWKNATLYIHMIWIYSFIISLPPFFGWGGYKLGK